MNAAFWWSVANHLWQSTAFAGAAWLAAVMLRKNHARVRHGVWLAASCKFLIPLSLLIAWGGHLRWQTPETRPANALVVMDEFSQPFAPSALPLKILLPPARPAGRLPEVLFAVWACGFVAIAGAWWVRWRRIR